jgi:putative membrane protein
MRKPSRSAAILVFVLAAGAACSGESAETAGEPAAEAAPTTAAAPQEAPASLGDAEIAHVAVTANTIDVEIAGLAQDRTTNPAVLGFARMMITDHTAVNERAAALAQRLGVTPADNATSRSLQAGAEVAYHQAVLDALDGALIPQASNGELRGLLEEVRPAIAAHLQHAEALRDSPQGQ